jgi:cell division protein FtsZ
MTINISVPAQVHEEMTPRITVFGVGGAGCNAVNNMIEAQLEGVDFVVANTDAQALAHSRSNARIQLGSNITRGLGAGSRPDVGRAAAEEAIEEIAERLMNTNMVFITAGMGGGTGTGAAPVIARTAREHGILTVGVVTKPFQFEGGHRMRIADAGIEELEQYVDTLIVIPNQNLFRIANEKTTFAEAFKMADHVLYSGVRGVTDLIVMPGLINLDFADIRAVMSEMGKAMMGTGEAEGERRALDAAEAAIANPLLDDTSMAGATGVLINITGGPDLTLFEVDEAANRIRAEVDPEAHIIFGSTFEASLEGRVRVSIVATGMDRDTAVRQPPELEHRSRPLTDTVRRLSNRPLAAVNGTRAAAELPAQPVPVAKPQDVPAAQAAVPAPAAADSAEPASIADMLAPDDVPVTPAAAEPLPVRPAAIQPAMAPPAPQASDIRVDEPFIPPAPVDPRGPMPTTAEPFAAAAVANGAGGPAPAARARPAVPSLFERVTGISRVAKPKVSVTQPTPIRSEPKVGSAPAAMTMAPESPVQPTLGGLDATERPVASTAEDDLLDIPAFLRRQAN